MKIALWERPWHGHGQAGTRPRVDPVAGRATAAGGMVGLLRGALVLACSVTGGMTGAWLFARSALPIKDPVGVVGVPILTGYSEAREQGAFYAFVAVTLLLAAHLPRVIDGVPTGVRVPLGAIGLLALACLPASIAWPRSVPSAALAGVGAFLSGARAAAHPPSARATVACLALWALGFPAFPLTLLSSWRFGLAAVVVPLAIRALVTRWQRTADWRDVSAALLVVCGTAIVGDRDLVLFGVGGLSLLLGRRAGVRALDSPAWLGATVVLAVVCTRLGPWPAFGWWKPALAVAGGAAGTAVLARPWAARLDSVGTRALRYCERLDARWLASVAVALVCLTRPWFGLLLCGATWFVARSRFAPGPRALAACAVAGVLLLALLPGPPSTPTLDAFHDGQILSAVWEFEQGRTLFAEVFPLRSYEFFFTWLARRLTGPSIASYFMTQRATEYLPVAALALLLFAWSRSLPWALVAALLGAVHSVVGGRTGVLLLTAALGVAVLRSRRRALLGWLAPGGVLAALGGFDVLIPLAAGVAAAALLAGLPGQRRPRKLGGVGGAWLVLAITLIPFTTLLGLWQGPRAVAAFWWLLVDNARNLPAFYGLRLPWSDASLRLLMAAFLVVLGTWGAAGAAAWRTLPRPKRRAGVFLLVHAIGVAQRALGRSDTAHVAALVGPTVVLGSILLFEGTRLLARRGVGTFIVRPRTVALTLIVWACAAVPRSGVTPVDLWCWAREFPRQLSAGPAPSAFVLERVGPRDYLWEMENGLMNYVHQRHNPTRHALTYCISSPTEQRVAVEALRARPPKLIAWQYLSGSNGIPNPLRYHVIAQHLYRHYRPIAGTSFLEPAPDGWAGQVELEPPFDGPLPLGRLPLRWGEDRAARFAGRMLARRPLELRPTGRPSIWEARGAIASRTWNYLKFDVACRRGGQAVLELAPPGRHYDMDARVTFAVVADGHPHSYVLPIGCSPGWSWRPVIERIRLSLPSEGAVRGAECWVVDDVRR